HMLSFRRFPLLSFVCALLAAPAVASAQHPLDPLSAAEIEAAAAVVGAAPGFPEGGKFATLVLKEPAKTDVLAYRPGGASARQAFATVLDRKHSRTFEAVVDVTAKRLGWGAGGKGGKPPVLHSSRA